MPGHIWYRSSFAEITVEQACHRRHDFLLRNSAAKWQGKLGTRAAGRSLLRQIPNSDFYLGEPQTKHVSLVCIPAMG